MYKYSVLTYIFGNYDCVREVLEVDSEAEYILVTDNPSIKSRTWTIVLDPKLDELSIFDKCYYVRFHPFEYVHSTVCVRIDGSILIKQSLSDIIDRFNTTCSDICLMSNPVFESLHYDYEYWVKNRNYSKDCAEKSLAKLYSLGYNNSYKGYYQLCFMIMRNIRNTVDLNNKTYSLLKELGEGDTIERFDQPVFCFLLNRFYENSLKIMMVDEYLITFSRYMQWYQHGSCSLISFKVKMKQPYLFNKPVKCERFDYLAESGNFKKKALFAVRYFCYYLTILAKRIKSAIFTNRRHTIFHLQ